MRKFKDLRFEVAMIILFIYIKVLKDEEQR